MKNGIILAIALVASFTANAQSDISIVVKNIKATKGNLSVCLVDKESDFLKDCMAGRKIKVTAKTETVTFDNIDTGEYAIAIFHDKNNDNQLNVNFLGIPNEPYGFSNNAKSWFGPPSYDKCAFQVDSDKTITIKL